MGLWEKILQGLETVDSYTGVPVRVAADADEMLQTGNPKTSLYKGAASFGVSPKEAPTGKTLLEHAGLWDAVNSDLAKDFMASSLPGSSAMKFFSPSLYSKVKNAMPEVVAAAVEMPLDLTNLIPVGALAKRSGKFADFIGDMAQGSKKVLGSEVGAIDPKDLLKLLKPGSENVYDLEKARSISKGGPDLSKVDLDKMRAADEVEIINTTKSKDEILEDLAKGFMDDLKAAGPQPTDEELTLLDKLYEKVSSGVPLSPKEEMLITETAAKYGKNNYNDFDGLLEKHWELQQERGGEVTSLNVEKGPAKELPEAGELKDLVRANTGDEWVGGLRKGGIFKAEAGPLKGQEFTPTGKSRPGSEASGWDTQHEVKTRDGKSHWFNSSEIYWMRENDPHATPGNPFATAEALAEREKRLARIREEMAGHAARSKAEKAAEAERVKKTVVSLDGVNAADEQMAKELADLKAQNAEFAANPPKVYVDVIYKSPNGDIVGKGRVSSRQGLRNGEDKASQKYGAYVFAYDPKTGKRVYHGHPDWDRLPKKPNRKNPTKKGDK